MAKIILPSLLAKHTEEQTELMIAGDSISDVLQKLIADYPALNEYIYNDTGQLQNFVAITVDGELYRGGDDIEVTDASEVMIMPATAGG